VFSLKRFDRQLSVGLVLILILVVPILGSAIYSLMKVVSNQEHLIETHVQKLILAKSLETEVARENAIVPVYIISSDDHSLVTAFENSQKESRSLLNQLKQLSQSPGESRILQIMDVLQGEREKLASVGFEMIRRHDPVKSIDQYFKSASRDKTERLNQLLTEYSQEVEKAFDQAKVDAHKISNQIIEGLGIVSAIAMVFLVVMTVLFQKILRQKRAVDEANERALKRERQLSSARKETVEVVAHDLRSPLSSIIMSTEMALSEQKALPEETKLGLEISMRSAQSMKRLIDDLLDHSKIESGSLQLERSTTDLVALVDMLLARFSSLVEDKGIRLLRNISSGALRANVDAARIEQVVSNLLGNALKFVPSGGSILISAGAQGDRVRISVEDSGPGMTQEQAEHIFERYWQVRKKSQHGIGLGLAICYAIVQAHGGSISVKSQLGKGSTFTILLPATLSEASLRSRLASLEASL
jgi:signal transduction histidine kinase